VRRAEHAAKHHYGRNALAVEVLKRSGEAITVGTNWSYDTIPDVMALLINLIQRLQEEQISGKWPYVVQAEAWTLEGLSSDAQAAELRRLLTRQAGEKLRGKEKKAQAEEFSEKLVQWVQATVPPPPDPCEPEKDSSLSGFVEMSRWLLVCSFMVRGGEV